ncbi:dihydrofolate reductase family protein [Cryptosporangium arvum]|uniref:Dihydrofolate reductase n=1 Tax=Cryptosporangium arvum DSM 44712 TaxID=927661 RepID=A0A010YP33_9ACTN|nr:dihydrofolate reductase family protein [Cryptosporangium arvum]EXG81940.1 dihydrofolate reductase [Cryptosporangium arvum DSM 44712]
MRKLVYYVGVSIDGYIAGPDGSFDFFPLGEDLAGWIGANLPETLPTHARAHFGVGNAANKRFDTVVMGLGTYRPALDAGIASPYGHLRQYVVSSTLGGIADPAVELVGRDPVALVRALKAEESPFDVWLAGGGTLAAAVLPEIDELVIKSYPIVVGDGISAFTGAFGPTAFTPAHRETFASGSTVTHYART